MFSLFMPVQSVIKDNRNLILIAAIFFVAAGILGYFMVDPRGEPLNYLIELQGMAEFVMGLPPLVSSLLIFLNNFLAIAVMLLLGVFIGLVPLLSLLLNGLIVGIAAAAFAGAGVPVMPAFLLGILPHGIFELFAVFLCAGLGLKFGYSLIFPLPGKNRMQSFKYIWKEAISALPLVALLLAVAALVEIFITPALLGLALDVRF